tara:strand:- start:5665 stop:6189 length:525 start_codon:yes stop_codon:yes gene_type:complete
LKISKSSIRILGLDPGSHITGVGVVDVQGSQLIHQHHQVIRAPKATLEKRLIYLFEALKDLSHSYQPDVVVVERVFLGKNVDSAFKLGHARGVALMALYQGGGQIFEISAREVKKILTGSGSASKEQVRQMVGQWLKIDFQDKEMDVSDALSLAISGSFEYEKRLRLKQLEGEL